MTLHDYVTAEMTYSTAHVRHEVCTWSQATHLVTSYFVP